MEGIKSRLGDMEECVSDLEDRIMEITQLEKQKEGFRGSAVIENLPANAGDTGLNPGLGRSHMPQSN